MIWNIIFNNEKKKSELFGDERIIAVVRRPMRNDLNQIQF